MLGLILLFAIAWAAARGLESAFGEVSEKHKKRIKKASAKKGRRTGAKLAAWGATAATAAGPFCKGFVRGWKREWPKAKERATEKLRRKPEPVESTKPEPSPAVPAAEPIPEPEAPAGGDGRKLVLIKNDTQPDTTTGDPMALATIPEITGVNTLKSAVARFASEATVTAEEAGAIAQRAADQLAAIEAAIEQATALEFGDDDGTLGELAALRDQYAAALAAAQALQKAAVDNAAIAAQSSKNIHTRHGGIQEAVASTGGRMASKQAYTADV
ncbi:hypothetical protein [Streptomyces massasporeus]|uniref:hypothetical protein n=1 Tax=Streptomyces massasporeus TaxID=67324 RepID=UPI0019B4EFBF|nr:hypothetical protein [Streptomyces massasporeus]GGV91651.1 hypothetical protein GCM10010228_82580 [Streptomyces massasporeus]